MIQDRPKPASTTDNGHDQAALELRPGHGKGPGARAAGARMGARATSVFWMPALALGLAGLAGARPAEAGAGAGDRSAAGRLAQAPQYPQPAPQQQPYPQQPQQPYPQQPYPQQPQQPYPQQPYPQQPQQPYPQQPQQPYPQQPQQPYPQQPQQPYPQQPYPQQPYPQQPQQPYPQQPPAPPPPPEPTAPEQDLPPTGSGLYPNGQRYYSLPPEQTPSLDRRGFVFQVGVGMGGVFDQENGRFGVGYDLAAGGMLNPRVAALFDYSALTFADDAGSRATHAVFGGALQVFFSDLFWTKIGVGLGQLSLQNSYGFSLDATERAFAGMVGFGIEVYQMQPDFAIDIQLKAAGGHYQEQGWLINGAVMIGLNGY